MPETDCSDSVVVGVTILAVMGGTRPVVPLASMISSVEPTYAHKLYTYQLHKIKTIK